MSNENPVVFYHKNCFDGLMSAVIAFERMVHGKVSVSPLMLPYEYGDTLPSLDTFTDRRVYLLDLTFDTGTLIDIAWRASEVTVIDHHPKAIQQFKRREEFPNNITFFVDTEGSKSGCQLTWEYFHKNDPEPDVVRWVGKRDRWVFDEPEIKPFTAGLAFLGTKLSDWFTQFNWALDTFKDQMIQKGRAYLEQRASDIDYLVANCTYRGKVGKYEVTFVNAPKFFASDVAERLYSTLSLEESPFVVVIYIENEKLCYSMRSHQNSTVDLNELAKEHGGGGHFHAAGFKRPLPFYMKDPQ